MTSIEFAGASPVAAVQTSVSVMNALIPPSSAVGVTAVHETALPALSETVLPGLYEAVVATRSRSRWRLVPMYAAGGLAWGVAARGWMRLLADDPEFSWSGTVFILILATVVWTGAGIVAATRSGGLIARRIGRVVGTILCLLLGFGQGMLLLPTALAGGALVGRSPSRRWVRRLLLALAVAPIGFLGTAIGFEGKHSAPRLVVILVATVLLCRALCVPYAALFRRNRGLLVA